MGQGKASVPMTEAVPDPAAAAQGPLDELQGDIARVIVPREQIAGSVARLAGQIAQCYRGRELTILPVLTGALVLVADLVRDLPLRMRLDIVSVSSYPDGATRSCGARFRLPPPANLRGRHILVVDDILDSGRTLALMLESLSAMAPASLRSCILLRKARPDLPDRIEPNFVGFDVADEFVVGYGLDYNHYYRNLPDICVLTPEALRRGQEGQQP